MHLGPTNSWLTTYCQETLGLSTGHYCPALSRAPRPPTGLYSLPSIPFGIGGCLKPRPFSGLNFLVNELLRTHYRVAVSEPTFLLSLKFNAIRFNT